MVDLTIVSCLAPCLLGQRDFEETARLFQPLLDADVPLVVYIEEGWKEPMQQRRSGSSTRFHATSSSRRWAAFGLRSELEAAYAASPHSDGPTLDYLVTTLTKMGMLHDQSIWNPFGTRHLVWIDADVPASVHPSYFADERVLAALPCLLRRFLLLKRPSAVADTVGAVEASRVQAQLFGGELGEIAHTNALYYQLLDQVLRRGELPTEESIFTRMMEGYPERFDRFILQENGLLGFLFEEMRTGRVSIERTTVY